MKQLIPTILQDASTSSDDAYELHTEFLALDQEYKVLERGSRSVDDLLDHLTGIKSAIEQYGISRPMMDAVDPNGELVAAGVMAAYENLSEDADTGIDAEVAIEGVSEVIKQVVQKIVDFFKSIGAFIKKWVMFVLRGFKHEKTDLQVIVETLEQAFTEASKDTLASTIELRSSINDAKMRKFVEVNNAREQTISAMSASIGKDLKQMGIGEYDPNESLDELSKKLTHQLTKGGIALESVVDVDGTSVKVQDIKDVLDMPEFGEAMYPLKYQELKVVAKTMYDELTKSMKTLKLIEEGEANMAEGVKFSKSLEAAYAAEKIDKADFDRGIKASRRILKLSRMIIKLAKDKLRDERRMVGEVKKSVRAATKKLDSKKKK